MFSAKHHEELFAKFASLTSFKQNNESKVALPVAKSLKSKSKNVPSKLNASSQKTQCSKSMMGGIGNKLQDGHAINECLDGDKHFQEYIQKIKNTVQDAYVAFVDISGFSTKIKEWSVEAVKTYLNNYYKQVFPIIKKYKGQIDKIMGDGIVVIFSDAFGLEYKYNAGEDCLAFCKECVTQLYGSQYPVKAAIGSGKIFFMQTGAESVYEECSCIGHPMTIAFRLENEAHVNEILIFEDDPVNETQSCSLLWDYHNSEGMTLKGLGKKMFGYIITNLNNKKRQKDFGVMKNFIKLKWGLLCQKHLVYII